MGSKLSTVFNANTNAGETNTVSFNASDLPSGVYLVVFRNGDNMKREKINIK